jgi:uncharacterized repeat protein (TIGR01451 family)
MFISRKPISALLALLALAILMSAALAVRSDSTAMAASSSSDQQAGSVLVYNYYGSSATLAEAEETLLNLTNTQASQGVTVHLFFVDGSSGAVKDTRVPLAPNQTHSFLASSIAQGAQGYMVAVAVDGRTGCPVSFNHLTGDAYIRFASGHTAVLGAVAFAALYRGTLPDCGLTTANAEAARALAKIQLDGISYEQAGRVLSLDSLRNPGDASSTLLIVNRLGGDLTQGLAPIGVYHGALYNQQGEGFRFRGQTRAPQLKQELSDDLLNTEPRPSQAIELGRLGWLRFEAAEDVALVGAAVTLNRNASPVPASDQLGTSSTSTFGHAVLPPITALNGGRNLRHLTTTSAGFIIPVIPAPVEPPAPSADLALTKTASPNPVAPGGELTYEITVTNHGPDAAQAVTVSDSLPSALTLVSCAATGGGVCERADNTHTVTFASLAAGESATITLVTKVNPPAISATPTTAIAPESNAIINTAIVRARTFDPTQDNNLAVARVALANATPPFAIAGQITSNSTGQITSSKGVARVKLVFTVVSGDGTAPAPVQTDAYGRWSQTGFQTGTVYRVTPTILPGCGAFTPPYRDVRTAQRDVNFTTSCR